MKNAKVNLENLSWKEAYQSQAKAVAYLQYSLSSLGRLIRNINNSTNIESTESENGKDNNSFNYNISDFGIFINEPLDLSIKSINKGIAEKSRNNLKEIRRRSSDRERSKEELEYLKRLLNSF